VATQLVASRVVLSFAKPWPKRGSSVEDVLEEAAEVNVPVWWEGCCKLHYKDF
jgi:hypothetical protein